MGVYRLEPVNLDDPNWEASSVLEPIFVVSSTCARARQVAAGMTLSLVRAEGKAQKLRSPWLLDSLTTCVLENPASILPIGTVTTVDGRHVQPARTDSPG